MSKGLINSISFVAGCIVLIFLANRLIADHTVPSLGEFLASSTQETASSTESSTTSPITRFIQLINATSTATPSPSDATSSDNDAYSSFLQLPSTSVFASKGSIKAFVADTNASREQGLSDIPSLPKGVGALFVFDTPGQYGFWMKDMRFPLDLIWIDDKQVVAGVTRNALPSSYPFVFMPPRDIKYVIEMSAGSATAFGLTTGTSAHFSLPN